MAAGDKRNFASGTPAGKRYFDGACEAMEGIGPGEFMVTPGDFDPPAPVRAVIDQYLGTNYLWYPVVGNHEIETPEDMTWVRAWAGRDLPHLVRRGPPGAEITTYSFDFGNSHFVVINQYHNGQTDVPGKTVLSEQTLAWLEKDLAATRKPLIWVFGHNPIASSPDMDTGRVRHATEITGGINRQTPRTAPPFPRPPAPGQEASVRFRQGANAGNACANDASRRESADVGRWMFPIPYRSLKPP